MYRVVKLGEHEVGMLATASTDLYYKQIFGIDPIKEAAQDGFEVADAISQMIRVAFVMAKQAELKDRKGMATVSEDSFFDWLDGYDRGDLLNAFPDIRALYNGQKAPTSEEKKRAGRR